MKSHVELIEGIKPDGVASCVAIRMIVVWQAECGVSSKPEDRVLHGCDLLVTWELDALRLGKDRVPDEVGTLNQQRTGLLKAVGRVGDIDRQPAVGTVDRSDLPSAKHFLHGPGSAIAEGAAFAIGQVVDNRETLIEGLVVAGGSALSESVREVDAGVVPVVGVEVSAGIVDRARPRERVQQIEAVAGAMFEFSLQRIIGEKCLGQSLLNGGEGGDGATLRQGEAARGDRRIASGRDWVRNRLIEVGEDLEFDSMRADIRGLEGGGVAELPLNGEVVALDVAGGQVFGDIARLHVQVAGCGNIGGIGEVSGVSLGHGAEARRGIVRVVGRACLRAGAERQRLLGAENAGCGELRALNDIRIDDGRQIIDQQVLTTLAVVLRIAESIACAYHCLRIERVRSAEAWSEVELGHIDQRAVVERTRRCPNERLATGVIVRQQVI